MFKKLLAIIFCALLLLTLFNFTYFNSRLVLGGVGVEHKLFASSSSSQIVEVGYFGRFTAKVKAETCVAGEEFNLSSFLQSKNAVIVFTETCSAGVNVYAFSPEIYYLEKINGKKINIHVFIGENDIKIGSPIIYESF